MAFAFTSTDLETGKLPDHMVSEAVLHNHNHQRSGDIYIVFKPHWYINDFDGLVVAASHGSPWTYDSYVPIVFAGNGLAPQKVNRAVQTVDIAITLANYLGVKPPSGASGEVLPEVLEK
ncbi:MAG: hypothetical protein GY751_08310 [Bacteroidetes bacterium]|nr:hypothetical protein [Bacteroidota bacterium]